MDNERTLKRGFQSQGDPKPAAKTPKLSNDAPSNQAANDDASCSFDYSGKVQG